MGAYNRINGEPACASSTYLKGVLYEEWKFDGYVVSDCGAIQDINENHHVTKNEKESAALAVNNGCQLNCGKAYHWVKAAVEDGLISEDTVTCAVERLFEARFRLGMFDSDCVYDSIPINVIECRKHRELNRKMAQESIVLLKNNGILPLNPEKTIAVIGPNADDKTVLLGIIAERLRIGRRCCAAYKNRPGEKYIMHAAVCLWRRRPCLGRKSRCMRQSIPQRLRTWSCCVWA